MLSLLAGGSLAALALTLPTQAQRVTQETRPPNIVLILMDDLGYGDLGSYGVPDAKTPHIDRLAREGVRLTDFYANGPSCSPTRAGLITGRYQQRYGIEWPLGSQPDDSTRGLLPAETSLPSLVKSAGYVTALIGKWHLGKKPAFHPNRHGFDEFWGFLGGAVDYYSSVDGAGNHDLFHNEAVASHSGYLTDEITARAKSFIETHRTGPFFLEVAYNATHWPYQPPGLSEDQRARRNGLRASEAPDLEQRIAILREGTRADVVAILEAESGCRRANSSAGSRARMPRLAGRALGDETVAVACLIPGDGVRPPTCDPPRVRERRPHRWSRLAVAGVGQTDRSTD